MAVWRLNLLRCGYLLLVVGLGSSIWPAILDPAHHWELMHGVVVCMLGALSGLAVLALRYPLRMLPLLFWELTWKTIWLLRVALPMWRSGHLDADTAETAFDCATAAVFLIVIPWDYVVTNFVTAPAEPWFRARIQPLPARAS